MILAARLILASVSCLIVAEPAALTKEQQEEKRMVAKFIDGKAIASHLQEEIAQGVVKFKESKGYAPGLAVILVGDDPASHMYVTTKKKACEIVGIESKVILMPARSSQAQVIEKIEELNKDPRVHGILVQMPLPLWMDSWQVITHIDPNKDVDGLHPHNLGLLMLGRPNLAPCTPSGCLQLILSVMPSLEGKHAVVVGRSLLVGRPMALLLSSQNATVVQVHSRTADLAQECRRADVLVVAVGKPGLITRDYVKPGAVVIDVGINRVEETDGSISVKGDVSDDVQSVAGHLTPVPGGVGPMTVAFLLKNTLTAALRVFEQAEN